MKSSTANQNLISTSPLISMAEDEFPQHAPDSADLFISNENMGAGTFVSGEQEKIPNSTPDNINAGKEVSPFSPSRTGDENNNNEGENTPTPYEVKHVVVGELEPEDDVWSKQKQRTNAFLLGVHSAKKWAPVLTGDTASLPDTIRTKLYDPALPDEDQEEDVKGDIIKEWNEEHMPGLASSPEEMEKMWPELREALAESLDTAPDNSSLYRAVSQKNRDYNKTLEELGRQFQQVEEQAHLNFSRSGKEENFIIPEDWLNHVPNEIHSQVKQALSEHHQDEIQRVRRLKPLYDEMRKAVKNMASFEEIKTVTFPMGNKAGGYEEIQFPLMIDVPALVKEFPSLSVTGVKLRQLPPEDRMLLFSQIDRDILKERKQNPPQDKGLLSELGHAVSRSHMKGVYGIASLSKAFDALSKDLTAHLLDNLPDSAFNRILSASLKEHAQKDREALANVQRMRNLAENRENPLYPIPDEKDNRPKPHWLKQCFLGFAEESIPIALAVACKPALLGWGGATAGNKYAGYEAEAAEKNDFESIQNGTEKTDSALSHANRFLSAIAMGGLQTLLEAGAYGKAFSPIVKSMPKVSAAVGAGVRPYVEQKAIALTEPLGAASAEYMTQGLEEGRWNAFDSDRITDALGDVDDNTREYLMNLPFIFLATGKVALHHFKSRKTILNDPSLAVKYKIPQKTINIIKKEKSPQAQSLLLQKALQKSPVWENPEVLYATSHFLNRIETSPFSGNTAGRYTPGSLAQLLELPPDKVKNHIGSPIPDSPLKQKKTSPFSSGSLTPLERKQMYWHSGAGLPSISPVVKDNRLFWELKHPQNGKYNGDGLYPSPEAALIQWQTENRMSRFRNREKAFSKAPLNFDPVMLKVRKEGAQLEEKIQNTLSHIDSLSSERLLFRSNSQPIPHQGKRSLNSLQKMERERTKAQIMEDAMQYAMDVPPEQIISRRLAGMWSDELKNKRISIRDASEWIDQWENISQKKLTPLSIDGFSDKIPYSSLSRKLASLTMHPDALNRQNILPPSFTESARITFEQLATANELARTLPETLFYSSQRRSGKSREEAFYKTLKNYIPQPEKVTKKNTTLFKKKTSGSSLANKPPALDNEFKQDLLWMEEQGISPLLSLSHKKTGQTQWVTVYPDGRISRPHTTPQEALLEWKEYGMNTRNIHLWEMGEDATKSLIDFYYGKNSQKRPYIKLNLDKKPVKTTESRNPEWMNERNNIAKLQNPHMEHIDDGGFHTTGSNTENIKPLGGYEQKIDIHASEDPLVLIEEHAEVSWRDLMNHGILSEKKAMDMLLDIQEKTKQIYLPPDLRKKTPVFKYLNIVEGLSQLSREYMMTQNSNKKLPAPLREWIAHMYISPWKDLHAIPLLRRSSSLKKMMGSGEIPQDFLNMIKESVGLNERFNKERTLPYSPHKLRILPILDKPRQIFDYLPEKARQSVTQKINSSWENGTRSPSSVYKKTKQKLVQLENDIKDHPELLEWDYDENSKTYRSLSDFEKKENISPDIKGLSKDKIETNIKMISTLRKSLDDMPYSDSGGIRFKGKIFSETSSDRPAGMNAHWKPRRDDVSEGIIYTNKDQPGHIIRISPGFIHDPHKTGKYPYIRHMVNENYLDAQGNIKSPYSPSTFIPLEKFTYKPSGLRQDSVQSSFIKLLDTLSNKKYFQGLLYTPNIAEMTTPTELVFQLREWKKKMPLGKKEEAVFDSLFYSVEQLKRSPTAAQTDLDTLSSLAKQLKSMLFEKQERTASPKANN